MKLIPCSSDRISRKRKVVNYLGSFPYIAVCPKNFGVPYQHLLQSVPLWEEFLGTGINTSAFGVHERHQFHSIHNIFDASLGNVGTVKQTETKRKPRIIPCKKPEDVQLQKTHVGSRYLNGSMSQKG